jgi:hypothetical protein
VAVLCPRFVVIRQGRLVANTTPAQARLDIEGTIFEGSIPADSYDSLLVDPTLCVTQAYLVAGNNQVRVYQPDGDPPQGFKPVEPTLEDAYILLIKRAIPSVQTGELHERGNGQGVAMARASRSLAVGGGEVGGVS